MNGLSLSSNIPVNANDDNYLSNNFHPDAVPYEDKILVTEVLYDI